MTLPVFTTPDDVKAVAKFLGRKPSGATIADASAVLGVSVEKRKLATMQLLGMLSRDDGRLKLTPDIGRTLARVADKDAEFAEQLRSRIALIPAYAACLEWAHHEELESLAAPEVGAFWHDHYNAELGTDVEREIGQRATCFLQLAAGCGLGEYLNGRRGQPTRLVIDKHALDAFVQSKEFDSDCASESASHEEHDEDSIPAEVTPALNQQSGEAALPKPSDKEQLGQAIFVGHGGNKKPLEQLRKILDQFKIPYKVAVDEPNLGRPISAKVRETMQECNCAILIFTADEEFRDLDGKPVWRPSQNVIHELGAAAYLYGNRIVILKESCIVFPTNFSDLGYISFDRDSLDAKSMDVLRELIGFKIVKITT